MKRKTSRLTISVVEGTPSHDWLYAMNQIMRGAAAQQALNVYHHLVTTGQIPMFGAVESIILTPAPAVPAAPTVAPVAPIQSAPAPVLHQVPAAAPVHVEPVTAADPAPPVAQVAAPVVTQVAPQEPMQEQTERTEEAAEAAPPTIKKGLVAGFRR